MLKLFIGLGLFYAAHLFKRLAPGLRRDIASAFGDKISRGLIGITLIGSVYLMTSGFRSMEHQTIYTPMAGMGYVNNILNILAIFAFGIGYAGGRLSAKIRHPMLWGLVLWASGHLLVNGDLGSIVLFGGLGIWAFVQMWAINQVEGPWEVPMPGNALQDWKLALVSLFLFGIIGGIHWILNHNPFLGTYT